MNIFTTEAYCKICSTESTCHFHNLLSLVFHDTGNSNYKYCMRASPYAPPNIEEYKNTAVATFNAIIELIVPNISQFYIKFLKSIKFPL